MSRKRFTKSQLEALKYLISKSRDLSEFARRCCVWMVDQSHGLTRNICVIIPADYPIKGEICDGIHNINSSGNTTHMDELLQAMGTAKVFSWEGLVYGGQAVYLSTYACDRQAIHIPFGYEKITDIKPWPPETKRALRYRKKKGEWSSMWGAYCCTAPPLFNNFLL